MQRGALRPTVLAAVLAALGLFILWQVGSGGIYLYVHERSVPLIALTAPVLLVMALFVARRFVGERSDWTTLVLLLAALGLGLVVPARPLGQAALTLSQAPAPAAALPRADAALRWPAGTLDLDLRQLGELARRDPLLRGLDGQRATLLGFVHRPAGLPADQFVVGRFLVRCCTADAVSLTMVVRHPGAADLAPDTWVEVAGTIARQDDADRALPLVEAERVTVVPQPARPYLYP